MIEKLTNFNTIDSNIDAEENDYCVNTNFEKLYKKINEIIEEINEMKEEC